MMSTAQLLFALSILTPACALAQNGVVQINQSTVAVNGNRATNGFPYIINQPGSYQLTSNLVVPAGANGIGIAASNVTLDLNGFTITLLGLNPAGLYAIGSPSMISVRNGSIVVLGENAAVNFATIAGINAQDLMITSNGGVSILVGPNSIVRHNIATGLISVTCPGVVVENVTTGFITEDVTSGNCVLWNNRALDFTAPVRQ